MSTLTLRIFISSPGDVGHERILAARVVERLQGEFANAVELQTILWEDEPLRATGHFQEQIVPPSATDIVVVILWSKLGTRLPEQFRRPDGTSYASGTEWELEDAARSYRERGTPDLLVYHKNSGAVISIKAEERRRQLDQLEMLETFLKHWFGSPDDSFKAAFHTFVTADQFERLLEKHLRKLIEDRLPKHRTKQPAPVVWHKGSPFRGLEVFDVEHAPVFFGRTKAIGEIKDRLVRQAAQGEAFVLVFGPSGCGKSSLVRAGVLPTITHLGVIERIGLWRWCIFRPGNAREGLCDGLARALLGPTVLPEVEAGGFDAKALANLYQKAAQGADAPIHMGLVRAAEALQAKLGLEEQPEPRLVVVVDQMEEIFTLERVDAKERESFIAVLSALARSGVVWVIATMRSEFYPRCVELPELVALKEGAGQYDLLPPNVVEIGQMIREPAFAAGLGFDVDLQTKQPLDDALHEATARDTRALPLMEFTLDELFKQRTEDDVLTFAAYRDLGGLEGALTRRAEEVFTGLEPAVQMALPSLMRALVTVGHGGEDLVTARRVPLAGLVSTPERKALLEALKQARLLVTDKVKVKGDGNKADDGQVVVGVAHEALLHHWPRLKEILDKDREFLRTRARVADAAARWRQEGQAADFLLHEGKPLAEAQDMLAKRRDDLDADVVEFIEASIKHLARDRRRKRRVQASVVVAFLAVLIGGLIISLLQWRKAERNAALAERHFQSTLNAANTLVEKLASGLKPIAGTKRETVAQLLRGAEGVYEQLPEDARQRVEVREGKARMLTAFSEVYREMGDTGKSLAYATGAQDIYGELRPRDPANTARRSWLAQSLLQAGMTLGCRGDSNGALAAFREALALREALAAEDPADLDQQSDVAESQTWVGVVLMVQGEMAQAKPLYEKAFETRKWLAEGNPGNARWRRNLAAAYQKIGYTRSDEEDTARAIAAYQEAVTLAERLVGREPDNLEWQQLLFQARIDLGAKHLGNGNLKAALEAFEPALQIAQRQTSMDPGNANWVGNLLYVRAYLNDLRADSKKPVEDLNRKLATWQELLALCERRVREDPGDTIWLTRRANTHKYIGLCYAGLAQAKLSADSNFTKAAAKMEIADAEQQRLADLDPDNRSWATNLALSSTQLAGVYRALKDVKKAREEDLRSARVHLDFQERLFRRAPGDPGRQHDLALAYQRIAMVYLEKRDMAAARDYNMKALEVQEALAALDPDNITYQRDLALTHWYLGTVLQSLNKTETAESLRHVRQAVAIRERVAQRDPNNMVSQGELLLAYGHLISGLRHSDHVGDFAQSMGVPPWTPGAKALVEAWEVWGEARPLRARLLQWKTANLFVPNPHPAFEDVSVSGGVSSPLFHVRVVDASRSHAGLAESLYRLHRGRIDKTLDLVGAWLDLAEQLDVREERGAAEARILLRHALGVLMRAKVEWKLIHEEEGLFGALHAALRRLPPDPTSAAAKERLRNVLNNLDYRTFETYLIEWGRAQVLEFLDSTVGDHGTAITLLRCLLAVQPEDAVVRQNLVMELYAAWRWKEAIAEQQHLIRQLGEKAPAGAYQFLASLQLGIGHPDGAAGTLKAAKQDPADPVGRLLGASVALQERRFETARDLALGLDADPKASAEQKRNAELLLSEVEAENGALADAELRVRRALATAPADADCLVQLAYLLAEQRKALDEAEASSWKALADNNDPRNLAVWGWVLAVQNKHGRRGLEIMEQVASHELIARDPVFFDHLGDVYRQAGRMDKARAAWRKSLCLFPKTAAPDDRRKREIEIKLKGLESAGAKRSDG